MDNKKVGAFIAELRKEKSINQSELAEHLGVTNKAVSKWECGDGYPEITLVPSIAKELGVTVDELLNGERNNTIPNLKTTYSDALIMNNSNKYKKYFYISFGIAIFGLFDLIVSKAINYMYQELFFYISNLLFILCLISSIIIYAIHYNNFKACITKYKDSLSKDEYYDMVKSFLKLHSTMIWTWIFSVALLTSQLIIMILFKSVGIFIFNIIIGAFILTVAVVASLIINKYKLKQIELYGIDKDNIKDNYPKWLLTTFNIMALLCGTGISMCGIFINLIYRIKIFRMLYNPIIITVGAIFCGGSLVVALILNIKRYKLK